jgi:hypothetical protein
MRVGAFGIDLTNENPHLHKKYLNPDRAILSALIKAYNIDFETAT